MSSSRFSRRQSNNQRVHWRDPSSMCARWIQAWRTRMWKKHGSQYVCKQTSMPSVCVCMCVGSSNRILPGQCKICPWEIRSFALSFLLGFSLWPPTRAHTLWLCPVTLGRTVQNLAVLLLTVMKRKTIKQLQTIYSNPPDISFNKSVRKKNCLYYSNRRRLHRWNWVKIETGWNELTTNTNLLTNLTTYDTNQ